MTGASKRRARRDNEKKTSSNSSRDNATSSADNRSNSAVSMAGPKSPSSNRSNTPGGGYDGNRDPGTPNERDPARNPVTIDPRNFDLGMVGWSTVRGLGQSDKFPARPGQSKAGTPIKMGLNTFHVEAVPSAFVYQFDVLIGNGVEKRGLVAKVWQSKRVKEALGHGWIFDGNKLAWNLTPVTREIRLQVDLDAEQGRPPREDKPNIHRVVIRQTNRVRLDVLTHYMEGKISFDNSCLEAINFLDHILRQWPSMRYTQIKRSFFASEGKDHVALGSAVEAFKGVYQSMRVVHNGIHACLSVNVDVANGTFWAPLKLDDAAAQLCNCRDVPMLVGSMARSGEKSHTYKQFSKKMRKLRIWVKHRGGKAEEFVIQHFIYQSAKDYKFEKDGEQISIYRYFERQYSMRLLFPDLPLVQTTKKNVVFPMEICKIKENQRYAFKLDEKQTSSMIKVAAVPPPQRWQDVQNGLRMLNWNEDPVLKHFGLRINPKMTTVNARLLPAPVVKFGQGDAKPGTTGRWDLRGKKFLQANPIPLKSWSVTVIGGRRGGKPEKAVIENFIKEFIKTYQSHGGRIENKQPAISVASGDSVGDWVMAGWNAAGNQVNLRPQMLMFVLPDKDSAVYNRIKRSADCRYGVVSQCVQYIHAQKCQPQYLSNVCLKFNAKLGGQTARAVGPRSGGETGMFFVPTMVIGADVSHAAPGSEASSVAAMTVSMDKQGIRYAATCETNGQRVEMITSENIERKLKPLVQEWITTLNKGRLPQRVIYFRDGVSEGQYQHVLQQEVEDMKKMIGTISPGAKVPFVVIVGSKRHHVRFFPEAGKGDRNGNPFPGSLVETGVTHPFEHDFYLCSQSAIKGTARPMHYHVLLNEGNMANEEIQTLIYEQCYQFVRSTTPVSQHPAIYYAHLASNRAVPHDPNWGGSAAGLQASGPTQSGSGSQFGHAWGPKSDDQDFDLSRLMVAPIAGGFPTAIWYV